MSEDKSPDLSNYANTIRSCLAAFLLGYCIGVGNLPPVW